MGEEQLSLGFYLFTTLAGREFFSLGRYEWLLKQESLEISKFTYF